MRGDDRVSGLLSTVQQAQDVARSHARLTHSQRRARFVDAALGTSAASARRLVPWVWGSFAAAAATAIVLLILAWPLRPGTAAMGFTVDGGPASAGAWIAASDREIPIAFDDGSAVRLDRGSTARVEPESDATGARIVLETGALHAEIVPRAEGHWRVDAGPFSVRVTGTIFDVVWDQDAGRLEVGVTRGSVEVTGPVLAQHATVTAGQSLELSVPAGHRGSLAAADHGDAAPSEPEEIIEIPDVDPDVQPDDAQHSPTRHGKRKRGKRGKPAARWRAAAAAGDYPGALALAEAAGFGALCRSASASDLLRLADVARYAKAPARAVEALTAVRSRFAGSPSASRAAYVLGRVASNRRGGATAAAKWFDTYLTEAPRGPLAKEALGRKLEALSRAGQAAAARRTAQTYLQRYPAGPHADLATRLAVP